MPSLHIRRPELLKRGGAQVGNNLLLGELPVALCRLGRDHLWVLKPPAQMLGTGGEPGIGRSQLLLWIAATVTQGGKWPCGEGTATKGSVVLLSSEYGIADRERGEHGVPMDAQTTDRNRARCPLRSTCPCFMK